MISSSFRTRSGHGKSFRRLHEWRCRNGDAQIRASDARFNRGAAAREVQIDRNFAGEHDREICHDRAFARRQDDPIRLSGNFFRKKRLKRRGRAEQFRRGLTALDPVRRSTAVRNGFRFKPRTQASARCRSSEGRRLITEFAELEQFFSNGRDVGASAVSGSPNATVTRIGNLRGHLVKKRPPWKEKIDPQSWSSQTGTTGASPDARSVRSRAANAEACRRVELAFGKRQTISPAAIFAAAARIAERASGSNRDAADALSRIG